MFPSLTVKFSVKLEAALFRSIIVKLKLVQFPITGVIPSQGTIAKSILLSAGQTTAITPGRIKIKKNKKKK